MPASAWSALRLGRIINTTPANPTSRLTITGMCSAGRGVSGEGRQAISAPPTMKAAIHRLLM
ncbi:hypothetical protein D3C71_1863150 [compost metagenome]